MLFARGTPMAKEVRVHVRHLNYLVNSRSLLRVLLADHAHKFHYKR